MKRYMMIFFAIAMVFSMMSCTEAGSSADGSSPVDEPEKVVTDVAIAALPNQLGKTIEITKTVSYNIGDPEITTYNYTIPDNLIGNHTIPEITVDGVTSDDNITYYFDVDFANTTWVYYDSIGDTYFKYEFNSDVNVVDYYSSVHNTTNYTHHNTYTVISHESGIVILDGDTILFPVYSTFTTLTMKGTQDYILQ